MLEAETTIPTAAQQVVFNSKELVGPEQNSLETSFNTLAIPRLLRFQRHPALFYRRFE